MTTHCKRHKTVQDNLTIKDGNYILGVKKGFPFLLARPVGILLDNRQIIIGRVART